MRIGIKLAEQGVQLLVVAFGCDFAQFFYRACINGATFFCGFLVAAAVLQIGVGTADIAGFFDIFRQRCGAAAFVAAEIGDFALPFFILLVAYPQQRGDDAQNQGQQDPQHGW